MTKFNPENKETMTFKEALSPAMEITEQEDADQYLVEYTNFIQKHLDKNPRSDRRPALEIAKINLGYYSGYCDEVTRIRIETLFNCQHPIFDIHKERHKKEIITYREARKYTITIKDTETLSNSIAK